MDRWSAARDTPLHIFTYADSLRPHFCILADSVGALGGSLNVLGHGDEAGSFGAVPPSVLKPIADALAEQGRALVVEGWRGSAPLKCTSRASCLQSPAGFGKIQKFMSLLPHLDRFDNDDVLLFLDGFDAVLEAPSLWHIRQAFERLQRRLGPLIGPSGGPVVFSGEQNCWPFPHPLGPLGDISGDYRADFTYAFGNKTRVRGDEMCEHWIRREESGGLGAEDSFRLPYINSGLFIGRAGSLRQLFTLAVETLRHFGDFEDQGLVYVMALQAAAADQPWVPLVVDTRAEILASLHGQDLQAMAQRLDAPRVCDFNGRAAHGYYNAALGVDPSRWNADRGRRPVPLIVHFNGDKKEFFLNQCGSSVSNEMLSVGVSERRCHFIDYRSRVEVYFRGRDQRSLPLRMTRALPRPLLKPSLTEVAGAAFRATTARGVLDTLLSQVKVRAPQVVQDIRGDAPDLAARRLWAFARGSRRWRPQTSLPHLAADAGLDVALVRRNETSCADGSDRGAYCALIHSLRASWRHLRPASTSSAGFLWAEFRYARDFTAALARADAERPARECSATLAADRERAANAGVSNSPWWRVRRRGSCGRRWTVSRCSGSRLPGGAGALAGVSLWLGAL